MAKIRLTKNELKKQRESLKRFRRYLPMLQLKKKQLQLEIAKIRRALKKFAQEMEYLRKGIVSWVDVFAEKLPLDEFCSLRAIKTDQGNVAGIDLPIFSGVEFDEKPYDLLLTPLWVDKGIEAIKEMIS